VDFVHLFEVAIAMFLALIVLHHFDLEEFSALSAKS
jgi:hypothetical protein